MSYEKDPERAKANIEAMLDASDTITSLRLKLVKLRSLVDEATGVGEILSAKLGDEDDPDFDSFEVRRTYAARAAEALQQIRQEAERYG